jgi:hypothetical protein
LFKVELVTAEAREFAGFEPHPPRTGGSLIETYPWHLALDEADRLVGMRTVDR